jgi:cytoskeletal protein CcmA (bactofilin family)
VIDEDLTVRGMITVGAVLRSGVKLVLYGMITGDLVVEAKARAIIHGMVNGVVYNDGGRIEIFGSVDAVVDRSAEAVTIVDPAAHVKGRR